MIFVNRIFTTGFGKFVGLLYLSLTHLSPLSAASLPHSLPCHPLPLPPVVQRRRRPEE